MKAIKILELLETDQIELLKSLLHKEYQEELSKNNGTNKLLSVVKKMMRSKECKERGIDGYILHNGKFYFSNGYMLLESDCDFGFEKSKYQFDIDRVVRNFVGEAVEVDMKALNIAIAKGKMEAKETKSKHKRIIRFSVDDKIYFDAERLKMMIEATGSNKVTFDDPLHPAYIGDRKGNVLLPIRIR